MTWTGSGRSARVASWVFTLSLACAATACSDDSSPPPPVATDDLDAYVVVPSANLTRLLADPGRPYVYVSDRAANTIHFFNTDTYLVERSVWVGSKPGPMDLSRDGSVLFVALQGASSVAVVDLATQTRLAPIAVSGTAEAVAVGSNDRLYVSVHRDTLDVFDVSSLPATPAGTLAASTLGGRTGDRSRLFTHDTSSSLTVTAWDVSAATAALAAAGDVCYGPPVVSPSPDGTTFAVVQDASYFDMGWPLVDGDVPIFRAADLLREGTVNVEWNATAVAMCPVTGLIVVAHDDLVLNPARPDAPRHRQGTGDLHAFDGATYVEAARYALRDRVSRHGIACGPDGRIYLVLGEDAGTAIGVIAP